MPGEIWLDDRGMPIESHLGGVIYENGKSYWNGMDLSNPTIPPQTISKQNNSWFVNKGVSIYSSQELVNWKFEKNVLFEVGSGPGNLLQPLNGLIRPPSH